MAFRTLPRTELSGALAAALRSETELARGARRVLERVFWGGGASGGARVVSLVPRLQISRLKEEA